jgi:hypothetical protein
VELVGKSEAVLAVLTNEKAVRAGGGAVLTAVGSWLPATYRCRNYTMTLEIRDNLGKTWCCEVASLECC